MISTAPSVKVVSPDGSAGATRGEGMLFVVVN